MLLCKNISKTFYPGTANERRALSNVSLNMRRGEFVVIIGGNGSGKSTLLNVVAGAVSSDEGRVYIDKQDVTFSPEHRRAAVIGRVFQDPMLGTAASMTIEENLALANRRGKRRGLGSGVTRTERALFKEMLKPLELGLEDRLTARVGLLSGGQRQALTLLMASLRDPKVLLLDEHTAALDPKTAAKVLEISLQLVREHRLTTLMVTHNMGDALRFGDRLIMMQEGRIVFEASGAEKQSLTVPELVEKFVAVGSEVLC
ncbi:MAG: ATP-binding cassette domain-containing protein [Coriobacteriia bacterium]|nr:ATP-binding cassette domain-containing protein [Coriobacteriia bacterium]